MSRLHDVYGNMLKYPSCCVEKVLFIRKTGQLDQMIDDSCHKGCELILHLVSVPFVRSEIGLK